MGLGDVFLALFIVVLLYLVVFVTEVLLIR